MEFHHLWIFSVYRHILKRILSWCQVEILYFCLVPETFNCICFRLFVNNQRLMLLFLLNFENFLWLISTLLECKYVTCNYLDATTFLVWKIWSHSTSTTRSYGRLAGWKAGRQADKIVLNLEIFKIIYQMKYSGFHYV